MLSTERPVAAPRVLLAEPLYHRAGEDLLRRHCDVQVLRSPTGEQIRAALVDAHAVAARYPHRIDDAMLENAGKLVVVACSGRGTDAIDIEAATQRGVAVVNNPGFGRIPVSESAIAMMLALGKRLHAADGWMRRGEGWRRRSDFTQFLELEGKVLGIVGLGEIGSETARKAIAAFRMKVLAFDPHVPPAHADRLGVQMADSLEQVLRNADIVSMHPELNSETDGMIGEAQLRFMKAGAYLINTSRGRVVRQAALVRALTENWIAGAALDVYEDEPMGPESPLYALQNVILMPHVAGLTIEAVQGMSMSAARQILQALGGRRPTHLLNPSSWPAAAARAATIRFNVEENSA